MAVFMVLTYCINAVPFDAVAISSPSEIASLESISPGQTKTVEITEQNGYAALKFTPTTSGKYYFTRWVIWTQWFACTTVISLI